MQLIAYLDFAGNCREAFDFYAQALGGTITMRMTYGESPMAADMPASTHGLVMHSQLTCGAASIMGADNGEPEGAPTKGCVSIHVDEPAEAERLFAALTEGGSVQMPLQETFWAQRFGMFVDRYGKGWMINCARPMP